MNGLFAGLFTFILLNSTLSLNFRGICYGPFRTEWSELQESTIREDLEIFRSIGVSAIRTYGQSSGQDKIPAIAKNEFGMEVYTGVWVNNNDVETQDELDKAIFSTSPGDILIVGNEHIFRTPEEDRDAEFNRLLGFFSIVRDSGRKVAYADVEDVWNGFNLSESVDIILLNTYSFWHPSCSSNDAAQDVIDSYINFKSQFQNDPQLSVMIGETGWASESCSICSETIQATFWKEMLEWVDSVEEKVFVFEAYDESWKSEGSHCGGSDFAKYFGVMNGDRTGKASLEEIKKIFMEDNDLSDDSFSIRSIWIGFVIFLICILLE